MLVCDKNLYCIILYWILNHQCHLSFKYYDTDYIEEIYSLQWTLVACLT